MAENKNVDSICCPTGSWPALNEKYSPKGKMVDLGKGLNAYVIGDPVKGGTAIIVGLDVFGVEGGRLKPICDQLSEQGYFVVCPDFFYGRPYSGEILWEPILAFIKTFPYSGPRKDMIDCVLPFIDCKGIDKIGLLGFCFGAWVNFHLCGDEKISKRFICAANIHPSINVEQSVFGNDQLELADKVQCPQLLIPAGNDDDNIKEDGIITKKLQSKPFGGRCVVKTFPDMAHGWVSRGDVTQEKVARDIKLALEMTFDFFQKNIK